MTEDDDDDEVMVVVPARNRVALSGWRGSAFEGARITSISRDEGAAVVVMVARRGGGVSIGEASGRLVEYAGEG